MMPALIDLILVCCVVPVAKHLCLRYFRYKTDELRFLDGARVVLVELIEPRSEFCKVVFALAIHILHDKVNELFGFFDVQDPITIFVEVMPNSVDRFLD